MEIAPEKNLSFWKGNQLRVPDGQEVRDGVISSWLAEDQKTIRANHQIWYILVAQRLGTRDDYVRDQGCHICGVLENQLDFLSWILDPSPHSNPLQAKDFVPPLNAKVPKIKQELPWPCDCDPRSMFYIFSLVE